MTETQETIPYPTPQHRAGEWGFMAGMAIVGEATLAILEARGVGVGDFGRTALCGVGGGGAAMLGIAIMDSHRYHASQPVPPTPEANLLHMASLTSAPAT